MSKAIIPFDENAAVPQHLLDRGRSDTNELVGSGLGVGGFPVISIRGSKWRLKNAGEEKPLIKDGNPIPFINVVILSGNAGLAKNYYSKPYAEGDDAAPDCWSIDGIKPDPSSANVQNATCATCKHNVWGSKITPQGTKTRSCADYKRLAVVFAGDLGRDEMALGPLLLRVPAASLGKGSGSLRSFQNEVDRRNVPMDGVVARLTFDINSDYPKIDFALCAYLSKELCDKVQELKASDVVQNITQSAAELAEAGPPATQTVLVEDEEDEEEEAPVTETATPDDVGMDIFGEDSGAAPAPAPAPRKKRASKKATAKKASTKKAEPVNEDVAVAAGDSPFDEAADDLASMFGS